MANDFFNKTGVPLTRAQGASAAIRAEFAAIEAAFNKFPPLIANPGKYLIVNAAGDGLDVTASGGGAGTGDKDVSNGFPGLTLFKINFKNSADTFTSFFTNANTASRTYTFPDKDGTVAMLSDITGGGGGTVPNVLINGDFMVDQYNSGAAKTVTAGAALLYTADMWYAYCTGANVTGQRLATGATGNQYKYVLTGNTGVTAIGFAQRIESYGCYHLAGGNAVLSVELSNSLLTSVTWSAYYANTADTFGTLAAPSKTLISAGTFTVSATKTLYSTVIAIPAAAVTGIEIVFSVGAQTSGTLTIENAQLQQGSTVSSYQHISYEDSLSKCQRHYEIGGANSFAVFTSVTSARPSHGFMTTKRVTPTIAITPSSGSGATVASGLEGFRQVTENSLSSACSWTASAVL